MKVLNRIQSKTTRSISRSCARASIALAAAFLAVWPSTAPAQTSQAPAGETRMEYLVPQPPAPVLDGHRFVVTTYVSNPFIVTQFRNTIGVGLSSGLSIPAFEIGGVEYNYETGKLLFSNIQAEYQYRVKDWLGVWGAFGLTARLGTETKSLVTQGVTVANGFDLGWKLRCYQSDNMLLTTTLRVHKSSFTAVDLIGFIDGIVEGVPESENQLVFTVPLLIGSTGFQYSWAVNQLIGVTASVGLGYGDSPDRRAENQWYFHAGGMLDFDLRRRLRVPLGVAAGMMFSDLPDQDSKLDGTVSSSVFRIDYIGRIDFNLGLEVTSQWYDITTMSESLRFTTATMDFRYYF